MAPSWFVPALAFALIPSTVFGADERKPPSLAVSQIWFERAIGLDIGAAGAPDAIQAFAAMRQAAEAGDPQAAFNVAIMLDSGRGVARDIAGAAVWYARAADRGVRRGAFNLGMLYENGEGVPTNFDLARAWYLASDLPAARERATKLGSPTHRPPHARVVTPLYPKENDILDSEDQRVDLVWTSSLQPEAVRYFVEMRGLDAVSWKETWSGFVDVSSVRLPLPSGFRKLAWRVSTVAVNSADYVVSNWSICGAPLATISSNAAGPPLSGPTEGPEKPPQAEVREETRSQDEGSQTAKGASHFSASLGEETSAKEAGPTPSVFDLQPRIAKPGAEGREVANEKLQTTKGDREGVQARLISPEAGQVAVAGPKASAILIVLAQPSVTSLSDLENKTVVIAGLTSIAPVDVQTALQAAGAYGVRLTPGKKSDIDKLVDGKVDAAIVASVTPEKAADFPQIPGFRQLHIAIGERRSALSGADLKP